MIYVALLLLLTLGPLLYFYRVQLRSPVWVFMLWFLLLVGPSEFFINASLYPSLRLYVVTYASLAMFVLGMLFSGKDIRTFPIAKNCIVYDENGLFRVLIVLLVISITVFSYDLVFGKFTYYSFTAEAKNRAGIIGNSVDILVRLQRLIIALIAGSLFFSNKKCKLVFAIVTLLIVAGGMLGYAGRQMLLLIPMLLFLIYIANCKVIPYLKITIGFAMLATCFFSLHFLRQRERWLAEGVNLTDITLTIGSGGEWNPVAHFSEVLIYEDEKPTLERVVERSLYELFLFAVNWVPRPLWEGKPATDFSQRLSFDYYGDTYYEKKWVRNFTFMSQLYYCGGLSLLLFGSLFFGFVTGRILIFMQRRPHLYGAYFYVLYLIVVKTRNSLSTTIFVAISTLVMISLLYYVFKKVFGYRVKVR